MRQFLYISKQQQALDFTDVDVLPKLPRRATKRSAGYDIYSTRSFTLKPGEEIKIPTGFRVQMDSDNALLILPRSGMGFKYYVRLANTTGVIDSDYFDTENEGHVWVKIRNESVQVDELAPQVLTVNQGDAICQGIFVNYLLVEGDNYTNGNTRVGGFGSTNEQ